MFWFGMGEGPQGCRVLKMVDIEDKCKKQDNCIKIALKGRNITARGEHEGRNPGKRDFVYKITLKG